MPPYLTFDVAHFRYLLTFAVLLVTAVLVSRQTLLIREQADAARQRERRTVALYQMTRELAAASTPEAIVEALVKQLEARVDVISDANGTTVSVTRATFTSRIPRAA